MELAPTPRRSRWSPAAWSVVVLLVLAPVTVLALVPTAFGMERYLMSGDGMSGAVGRGAVLFEQRTPLRDVEVDDVVTFAAEDAEQAAGQGYEGGSALVTRRVVAVADDRVVTASDEADPSRPDLSLRYDDQSTIARVLFVVPLVGYPFLGMMADPGWGLLLIALGVGLGAASACARGRSQGSAGRRPDPASV